MGLAALVRANEWRECKLAPLLAVFYLTLAAQREAILPVVVQAAALFVGLVAGAVFVSLVNDATDRADDARAGKPNRLAGLSPAWAWTLLLPPVAIGAGVAWLWRAYPLVLAAYGAAWIAFTAYSVPPVRLKIRGFAGVLADAGGAHLFPSLTAALLAFAVTACQPDPIWLGLVAVWSLCLGMRGILAHQFADAEADRAAGVRTFVVRSRKPNWIHYAAERVLFPAELIALLALLWVTDLRAPLIALALYTLMAIGAMQRFGQTVVITRPRPRPLLLLNAYYELFLPLSLLLASALAHRGDVWMFVLHCVLFPGVIAAAARDLYWLARIRSA